MPIGANPTRLITLEQAINYWVWSDAPAGVMIETLLDPATWQHVAPKLLAGSHLIVQPEGLPWEAELIVLDAGTGFAKVRLLRQTHLNEAGEVPAQVYVKWNGPKHRYAVFRKSDDVVLHYGCAAREDAETWARIHVKAMAA